MPASDRNAPQVTVFGFYGLGNFGDDLMGWMIARQLAALGKPSVLCSLSDQPSDSLQVADFTEASIASTRSIEEALENSTAAVLGGGGLLVPHTDRKLKRFAPYFGKIEHLLDSIARRRIPLALISVGGDGDPSPDNLSRRARKALGHASMVTTRNPSDVALLEKCGITSHCYPDLVWLASTFRSRGWPGDSMRKKTYDLDRPLRIGLDLHASNLIGKGMLRFLAGLYGLVWTTSHLQFVTINSKHARCGTSSGMGAALSAAIGRTSLCRFCVTQRPFVLGCMPSLSPIWRGCARLAAVTSAACKSSWISIMLSRSSAVDGERQASSVVGARAARGDGNE